MGHSRPVTGLLYLFTFHILCTFRDEEVAVFAERLARNMKGSQVGLLLNIFGLTEDRPAFSSFPRNTNLTNIGAGRNVICNYVDTKGKSHWT